MTKLSRRRVVALALAAMAIVVVSCDASGVARSADQGETIARLTPDNLYGVVEPVPGTILVCGYYGTLLRSEDGGQSWMKIDTGTRSLLRSIVFATADHGWAVGLNGTVIHSSDRGLRWVKQSLPTRSLRVDDPEEYLRDVAFSDAKRGVVIATARHSFLTDSGGERWSEIQLAASNARLNRIRFFNGAFWVVGEFGTILRSDDLGATWVAVPSGTRNTLTDITFADRLRGYVVGIGGKLLVTEDGGGTWREVALPFDRNLFSAQPLSGGALLLLGDGVLGRFELASSSMNSALITGRRTDEAWYYRAARATDGRLLVVGMRGMVLASKDGGGEWQPVLDWRKIRHQREGGGRA